MRKHGFALAVTVSLLPACGAILGSFEVDETLRGDAGSSGGSDGSSGSADGSSGSSSSSGGSSGSSGVDGGDGGAPLEAEALDVTAGNRHTCAIYKLGGDRRAFCWGADELVGAAPPGRKAHEPNVVQILGGRVGKVASSGQSNHTCAIVDDGEVFCWGHNDLLELGSAPTAPNVLVPRKITKPVVRGVSEPVKAVALGVGSSHACILHSSAQRSTNTVVCWGYNKYLQLGAAAGANATLEPVEVDSDLDPATAPAGKTKLYQLNLTSLAAGFDQSCAIPPDKDPSLGIRVFCWGANDKGEVNYNGRYVNNKTVIGDPFGSGGQLRTADGANVGNGAEHFTWVEELSGGSNIVCSGSNAIGQCDPASASPFGSGLRVAAPAGKRWVGVAAGVQTTCAIRDDGRAECWGQGGSGELGVTPAPSSRRAVVPGIAQVKRIALGGSHVCAVAKPEVDDGRPHRVFCWGNNGDGQAGQPVSSPRVGPTPVPSPKP
ncbi:MAG: hypothetical protein JNL38_12880 [Myxococcales bacterium]|nr:hypothetical protein [Myxococcales bacterium]